VGGGAPRARFAILRSRRAGCACVRPLKLIVRPLHHGLFMTRTPAPPPKRKLVTLTGKPVSIANAKVAVRRSLWWFWGLAGFSLINCTSDALGFGYRTVLGLGVTQLPEGFLPLGQAVRMTFALGAVALMVVVGLRARRFSMRWYVVGMFAYAADTLVSFVLRDWIALGVHAFVLFMLYGGYLTLCTLKELAHDAGDSAA
jgi:hypothetical protein